MEGERNLYRHPKQQSPPSSASISPAKIILLHIAWHKLCSYSRVGGLGYDMEPIIVCSMTNGSKQFYAALSRLIFTYQLVVRTHFLVHWKQTSFAPKSLHVLLRLQRIWRSDKWLSRIHIMRALHSLFSSRPSCLAAPRKQDTTQK